MKKVSLLFAVAVTLLLTTTSQAVCHYQGVSRSRDACKSSAVAAGYPNVYWQLRNDGFVDCHFCDRFAFLQSQPEAQVMTAAFSETSTDSFINP